MSTIAASTLLGGIGLFLLGMSLMTDSLTALGANALRRLLAALTRNRYYALLTGAAVTATLQSSSATTLVTVGFVSAGLLSFAQSLGVIFGANIGTTSTAWIVSQIGLEVDVSAVALPLVGVGALVRLVTRGRRARLGLAMSGFGLIFVGIDVMQAGMAGMDLDLTPDADGTGPLAIVGLVAAGTLMTVVMQSSSAAVATTLVALHAGTLNLEQAAALVIGQNVGTTVTAILGAIGGGISARRAAVAHTMFNVGTGIVALAILRPFLSVITLVGARLVDASPETAVALFHTSFNVLGVAIFFPLTDRFAALVERMVPRQEVPAVRRLAKGALQIPALALESARRSTAEAAADALRLGVESLRAVARPGTHETPWRRTLHLLADPRTLLSGTDEAERALLHRLHIARSASTAIASYLSQIRTSSEPAGIRDEHVELLHAVDHLRRLVVAIEREEELDTIESDAELRRLCTAVVDDLALADSGSIDADPTQLAAVAEELHQAVEAEAERRDAYRVIMLARIADGEIEPAEAETRLRASRWMAKIPKHAYRAFLHLAWTAGSAPIREPED